MSRIKHQILCGLLGLNIGMLLSVGLMGACLLKYANRTILLGSGDPFYSTNTLQHSALCCSTFIVVNFLLGS